MIGAGPHLGDDVAAVVDGELAGRRRERALRHLLHCAWCRSEVAAARQVKARLTGPLPPAPAALADRLVALSLGPRPAQLPPGRSGGLVRRAAVGGAAVVLGLGLLLALAGPRTSPPRPPVDPAGGVPLVEHAGATAPVPRWDPSGTRAGLSR